MSSRRQFVIGGAALTASIATLGLGASPLTHGRGESRPPNVVVILADDLGYGELGCYGQRLMQTPRIDQLAAEGLRFTQAYAAAAVCAPSRCSLLTGMHAGHASVRNNPFTSNQTPLDASDTTFAQLLHDVGYSTACVGKWGFGPEETGQPSHPNECGFEDFYGYIRHRHAKDYFPDYLWHNGERDHLPPGAYAVDALERHALSFMRRQATYNRPFPLYLSPNLPHSPNVVPDAEMAPYLGTRWAEADRSHAAQVTRLDQMVGAVVDELHRLGIAHNTLVLVTSDNGPHEEGGTDPELFGAAGPLRGYKRNLYEGGIRVPLIAWHPGSVTPGAVVHHVTSLTDVLPTLAELSGATVPADVDGVSLMPLLGGVREEQPDHRYLYWYRNEPFANSPRAATADGGRMRQLSEAVRRGDWKLVRFAPGRNRAVPDGAWEVELYHLATDPGETTNVAAEHPERVAELTLLMRSSWVEPPLREARAGRPGGGKGKRSRGGKHGRRRLPEVANGIGRTPG